MGPISYRRLPNRSEFITQVRFQDSFSLLGKDLPLLLTHYLNNTRQASWAWLGQCHRCQNQSRRRAPNLTVIHWMLLGFWSLFLTPPQIKRAMFTFEILIVNPYPVYAGISTNIRNSPPTGISHILKGILIECAGWAHAITYPEIWLRRYYFKGRPLRMRRFPATAACTRATPIRRN